MKENLIEKMRFKLLMERIVVVIVLYKANLFETPAYISLNNSIKYLDAAIDLEYYVFDNSPESVYQDYDKLKDSGIKYIYDQSNPGLSKPSNDGASFAAEDKKEWILFTNPDTSYPLDYFQKLYIAINDNPTIELFAPILLSNLNIVSPARYNFFIGSSPKMVNVGVNNLDKKLILYSGMFISLNAFYKTGGFNNKIKLDFMDCYFSENYKKQYANFFLLDVKCQHDLSSYEMNVEKVLNRFKYYCEGAKYFASSKKDLVALFFICLLRAVKLSFKLNRFSFPLVVFKVFAAK